MRLTNSVLISLICLVFIVHILQNFTENLGRDGWGFILGQMLGVAPFVAPFYLARCGLSPASTIRMAWWAQLINILAAALIVLIPIVLIVAFSDKLTLLIWTI